MEQQETHARNPFAAPEPVTAEPTYDRDDEIMAALGLGDPKKEVFTAGHYLAGWLFLGSGASGLAMMILLGVLGGLLGIVFDCLVGGLLVARKYGIVGFAKFRAFATSGFGIFGIIMGNFVEGGLILLFSLVFHNLLFGNPGLGRRLISGVVGSVILLFSLVGIVFMSESV